MQLPSNFLAGFLCASVLVLAVPVAAQDKIIQPNFDPDAGYQWKQDDLTLPPPPVAENLIPFTVSTSKFAFALDRASLVRGLDNIVRYTLVMTSTQGARNVTYEGLRCATAERQTYAFGRPDGTWSKAREPQWVFVRDSAVTRHHFELLNGILCRDAIALSTKETLTILQNRR